jgi:hypothetical protein
MPKKSKRGRPPTFTSGDRRYFADLIRLHGARKASEVSKKPVSAHTLLKVAREFEIELKSGRRPKAA